MSRSIWFRICGAAEKPRQQNLVIILGTFRRDRPVQGAIKKFSA